MSAKSVLLIVTTTVIATVAAVVYVQAKFKRITAVASTSVEVDHLSKACDDLFDAALAKGTLEGIHLAENVTLLKEHVLNTGAVMEWHVSFYLYTIRKIMSEIQLRPITRNDISVIRAFVP